MICVGRCRNKRKWNFVTFGNLGQTRKQALSSRSICHFFGNSLPTSAEKYLNSMSPSVVFEENQLKRNLCGRMTRARPEDKWLIKLIFMVALQTWTHTKACITDLVHIRRKTKETKQKIIMSICLIARPQQWVFEAGRSAYEQVLPPSHRAAALHIWTAR